MAIEKITEKPIVDAIASDASVVITQTGTAEDGSEALQLKRASLAALILVLKEMGVNDDSVDTDAIVDGSITYEKLSSELAQIIENLKQQVNKAYDGFFLDSSTYDKSLRKVDIFDYAKARAGEVQSALDAFKTLITKELEDAYVIDKDDNIVYDTLGNAVRGVLDAARAYSDSALVEYKPFTTVIVDKLPVQGEPRTYYLIQNKAGTGYDKYWYVDDGKGGYMWDVFGSATTVIVGSLAEITTPSEDVDYIVNSDDGCLYYKYINGNFKMVGGSTAQFLEELPEEGNSFTDYFIKQSENLYLHYRYANGVWAIVGGDCYTKQETDQKITELKTRLDAVEEQSETNKDNIDSVSRGLTNLQQEVANIDTEGYQYSATYEDNTFSLIQSKGSEEEVVSSFVISGGGGGGTTSTTMTVEKLTDSPLVVTPTDKAIIKVLYSSVDADGETYDGTYTLKVGNTTVDTGVIYQGEKSFDVTDYITVGTQKVTLNIEDEAGSKTAKSWTVQMVDVRLESSFSDRVTYPIGKTVNFTYTPYGSVSKTVHFKLDGVELESVVTASSGILQQYVLPAQTHGAHLLECYMTAKVNNIDIETAHIYKDIIWFDEESTVPVIGCAYRSDYYGIVSAKQYDSTVIPYVVYDPSTSTPTVSRKANGKIVSTETMTSYSATWTYKTDEVGTHTLVLACKETSVEIKIDIAEIGIDVSPVTANLAFDFNPTGKSNNSENRLWTDANDENVKMTVSDNFDWSNGGYQTDEDGNQYFGIKAGTRAYISYNMFSGNDSTNISTNGMEFKVVFRVSNVKDINATWLTCISGDSKPVGLQMKAHEAYLTSSASNLEQADTYLYMPYSEDDVIELEVNVNQLNKDDSGATSYIMSYEDGVGLKALIYDSSHRWYQPEPVPITIGSDDCDVRIYRVKAYSAALTDTDILNNFIADARSSEEMVLRYNRNQIYNDNGQLTPDSVAQACPQLKVIKIDAPYFTNDKKNYVKNTTAQCIHKGGDPILDNWTFSNGYHSGQGTTSNEYGYAARNLDLIFNCDGVNKPMDKIDAEADYVSKLVLGDGTTYADGKGTITLTRTSVGTNWLNIKVNVASSENANNALLQKRYNDFLTYTSLGQVRDPFVKNSMEFVNCVVFIRENDPDVTKHREFSDTDWHFYAIGNIGDSKKTDYTRAYDQDDINEFVLEISDNGLNNSIFQTGVYLGEDGERKIDTPSEVLGSDEENPMEARSYIYPILPSEWNASNGRYASLYADQFDGDTGSYELRYGCKGDFKDGKLVVKSDANKAQLLKNADVWRAFYRWVITSTNQEFANELGEWFIEDSATYWYVFTHHFTMIDNRAKNTFWHFARTGTFRAMTKPSAELLHIYCELVDGEYVKTTDTAIDSQKTYYSEYAFDMWDYDNDTALGINNSGELTMSYGKEDIDYKVDGDANSGWLFNAANSVFWCRIRDVLASQCSAMYQKVDPACWSASDLITEFDNWQAQFPEELWRLDIERKYLRTYQGSGLNGGAAASPTPRFLKSMMQGRKKYQRRQWIRDQEDYFGTKYLTSSVKSDQIMFRCNTPTGVVVAPNYTLKIVPYSDMYLSVMFGNSAPSQIRAKAGVEYEISCPYSIMDDTAVLIYCASKIQSLNDLSAAYIHDNDFSKATKLKKLVVGSSVEGYDNPYLTSLNMGDNVLLQELDIRNCGSLAGSLNLSSCNNLEKLYAEGTVLASVTFSVNGKLKIAHLPGTINSLTLRYLNYLTDLQTASLDNLETLVIEHSNVDALSIVEDAADTLISLKLSGIDWSLESTDLLDSLLKIFSSSIAGKIYVPVMRQSKLNSYKAAWGDDLEITYTNLQRQYLVTFKNDDGEVLYSEYVDAGASIKDPVLTGVIPTPTKASTASTDFTYDCWDGTWNEDGESTSIDADTVFNATYTESIRQYTVKWYGDLSSTGTTLLLQESTVNYGTPAAYEGDLPTYTGGESGNDFYLFESWDKSTGCIREDTIVHARWQHSDYTFDKDSSGKIADTGTLTAADVYAIKKKGTAQILLSLKDRIPVQMGYLPDFDNVAHTDVATNYVMDGETYKDTGIKMLETDSSWTFVVDVKFVNTTSTQTAVSCFEDNGYMGIKVRYNEGPSLQWSTGSYKSSAGTGREIMVVRHIKGDKNVTVYSSKHYTNAIGTQSLTKTINTVTDKTIVLGAYVDDAGYVKEYAKGTIYKCRVYHDDLGDAECRKIVRWPGETYLYEVANFGVYMTAEESSKPTSVDFICASLLERTHVMNSTNTTAGGFEASLMNTWLKTRVYPAFAEVWKAVMAECKVDYNCYVDGSVGEVKTCNAHIWLPAYADMQNTTAEPWIYEGDWITYFVNNASRIKFLGITVSEDAVFHTSATDPADDTTKTVKTGDIWINTADSSRGYIRKEDGTWFAAYYFWLRGASVAYSTYFCYVNYIGYVTSGGYSASYSFGVCPRFSI